MRKLVVIVALLLSFQSKVFAADVPVIVQLSSSGSINQITKLLGGTLLDSIPGANTHLLLVPELPVISPLLSLLGLQSVELVKAVDIRRPQGMGILSVPKASHWYVKQPAMNLIQVEAAQQNAKGRGVVVADLNSRVDYGHPALAGHLTGGYDFVSARASYSSHMPRASEDQSNANFLDQSNANFLDQSNALFLDQSNANFLDQSNALFLDQSNALFLDSSSPAHGHGTMCAGIIAAVAPESMIMPMRVFDDTGDADTFSIAKAIRHSVSSGADVINLSFGMTESSGAVKNAIGFAISSGVTVVASAGNNNTAVPQYPAAYSNVIAVAATDLQDRKAVFSNFGSSIYVTAPGVNIISAYPGGYYAIASGTSYSAPMVAAEAALLRSVKRSGTRRAIGEGTADISSQNPAHSGSLGRGRVNLTRALKSLD